MTDQTNKDWSFQYPPTLTVRPPPNSKYIGLIVGSLSGRVYSIVNPDVDSQLDNPRFLLLTNQDSEPMRMEKVPRRDFDNTVMTPASVQRLRTKAVRDP